MQRCLRLAGTLRARLLASFVLVALLPLGAVIAANDRATRALIKDSAYVSLGASASRAAVSVDAFLHANLTILATEARLPVFSELLRLPEAERGEGSAARADVRKVLASLVERDRVFIASYALLDAKGRTLVDTGSDGEADESARGYFVHAVEYDEASVSDIEFLPSDGKPYLYFSSPVHDAAGAPVGVLRVRFSASVIEQIIVEATGAVGSDSFAMIVDDQRMVLAHGMTREAEGAGSLYTRLDEPPADVRARLIAARRLPPQGARTSAEPELLAALSGTAGDKPYFSCRLSGFGDTQLAAAGVRMREEPWTVLFFVPQKAFLAPVEANSRSSLMFALAVLGLALVTSTVVARSLARPITRLTDWASRLAEGNLSVPIKSTSRGEIGVLEAAFCRMADDIKRLVCDLAERNEQLHGTNDALQRQNALLEEEIAERARRELVLEEQQEAIRRLSTPILAVWDGVLALPVIGVVDEARAAQMMEKLLDAIVRLQASVAIFDLTGVERVDAPTASYLLKVVRAANLLGSRCVLSGIRPGIATEMVGIELGEDALVPFRTLQGALRYAIGSARKRAPSRQDE